MAEAEEVITDAARHATVFVQQLWHRHRPAPEAPATVALADIAARTDLLLSAVFDAGLPLRVAQPPARPTLLSHVFRRTQAPHRQQAIPATDGINLWLPSVQPPGITLAQARQHYRLAALQQAMRARRGSANIMSGSFSPLEADVYLLLEAHAADADLLKLLPGIADSLAAFRQHCLKTRPSLDEFSSARRPLETLLRDLLKGDLSINATSPEQSLIAARNIIPEYGLPTSTKAQRSLSSQPLLKDWWTGELRAPNPRRSDAAAPPTPAADDQAAAPRSARLARRPDERKAKEGEDDEGSSGILMVQLDEPHKHAEDPMGLQRPVDRDAETSAEEFGDLLSELPEARLVCTPGRPKEVLLTDDPPDSPARQPLARPEDRERGVRYPEWDYRTQTYNTAGATVKVLATQPGNQKWVDDTLAEHRTMLHSIRRRFEMVRATRTWQRRRLDGDEIDIDAFTDSYADYRAGGHMNQAIYQTRRPTERSMAITLLIDVSGSTDSWVSANRRVIDVEREALLLVCIALEGLGEPFSVQAFSGEGPSAVTLREIKRFDERYSNEVALRISGLEPEHYTRAGAAIRHASANLMRQPVAHRLLLLLSDGKPNDIDNYEGRYGVEDMRQAVIESKLQGIFPFCLTIDRQSANYLPRIFGASQYALLPKPELLPLVLLDWMKRLLAR